MRQAAGRLSTTARSMTFSTRENTEFKTTRVEKVIELIVRFFDFSFLIDCAREGGTERETEGGFRRKERFPHWFGPQV